MTFIALSLVVAGSKTYTSIQKTTGQKLEFKGCRTYDDYSGFIKEYLGNSLKSICDSVLHEFNILRNNGCASVNGAGDRDIRDREKGQVDVRWNPTITLPQLRSLVGMMSSTLLTPARDKELIIGRAMGKGYDSLRHTVALNSGYYVYKYEVTRSLWCAIMNDSIIMGEGMLFMTHMIRNDAEAFTKKLDKLAGLPFSFPVEA